MSCWLRWYFDRWFTVKLVVNKQKLRVLKPKQKNGSLNQDYICCFQVNFGVDEGPQQIIVSCLDRQQEPRTALYYSRLKASVNKENERDKSETCPFAFPLYLGSGFHVNILSNFCIFIGFGVGLLTCLPLCHLLGWQRTKRTRNEQCALWKCHRLPVKH